MATISKVKNYYKIQFYDSKKSPKTKAIYLNKDNFSKPRDKNSYPSGLISLKQSLEFMYMNMEYDPWEDDIPELNDFMVSTLKDAVNDFVSKKKEDWNKKTFIDNRNFFLRLAKVIGEDMNIKSINEVHFNDFINNPKFSYATKISYRRKIKSFCDYLGLDRKKIHVVKRPDQLVDEPEDYYAPHIRQKFRQRIMHNVQMQDKDQNDQWLLDFIDWQFYSGMRANETLSLTRDNFDFDGGYVTFRQKGIRTGARVRKLYYSEVPALKEIAHRRLSKDEKLFNKSYSHVAHRHRAYIKSLFPNTQLNIHSWRHTCGIELLENDVSEADVQKWLGHTNPNSTKRYAKKLSKSTARRVGSRLNFG